MNHYWGRKENSLIKPQRRLEETKTFGPWQFHHTLFLYWHNGFKGEKAIAAVVFVAVSSTSNLMYTALLLYTWTNSSYYRIRFVCFYVEKYISSLCHKTGFLQCLTKYVDKKIFEINLSNAKKWEEMISHSFPEKSKSNSFYIHPSLFMKSNFNCLYVN